MAIFIVRHSVQLAMPSEAPTLTVSSGSELVGKTIRTCGLKDNFGIQILGVQQSSAGEIVFNPPESMPLVEGATLVVMGELEKITKLRSQA